MFVKEHESSRKIKMIKTNSLLRKVSCLGLTAILASGCADSKKLNPAPSPLPSTNLLALTSSMPEISYEGRTPIEKIDLSTVSLQNTGFYADLNCDERQDFVILRENILYFSAGKTDNSYEPEKPILKVNGVVAYRLAIIPNRAEKPSLIYFDNQGNGYLQPNKGADSAGLPIFGDAEVVSSKDGFDF